MNDIALLRRIIDAVKTNNETTALAEFDVFLTSIPDGSGYKDWTTNWCDTVYVFGRLFSARNPQLYLDKLRIFAETNERKKEVVDFIYSEVIWNYFTGDKTFVREEVKSLKARYPTNPEFHHTYSHILDDTGNYKESLGAIEQAIKIDSCERFVNTYINRVRDTFNKLISKDHIKEAKEILERCDSTFAGMSNRTQYTIYTNALAHLKDRLGDHFAIEKKISKIDEVIAKRTEALRNRFISMLGVFAAIIAFILTTVNIAIANLNVKEAMLLMLAMADVLIIFSISIDYVFRIRRTRQHTFEFLGDKQFLGIVVLLFLLFLLYQSI